GRRAAIYGDVSPSSGRSLCSIDLARSTHAERQLGRRARLPRSARVALQDRRRHLGSLDRVSAAASALGTSCKNDLWKYRRRFADRLADLLRRTREVL